MLTKEQNEALNQYRIDLYHLRTELWDAVPEGKLTAPIYLGIAEVAKRVLAGEVSVETVKANIAEF